MKQRALYEKLRREAASGATLSELEAEIDREGRVLTVAEQEEAWLYAWALRKRQERRPLGGSAWREIEQGYGYVGDAGAG
jgi:hypothetical protein